MPFADRQFDHAVDVTYESMVAHHGRFFSLVWRNVQCMLGRSSMREGNLRQLFTVGMR